MKLPNLATRPFLDTRPVWVLTAVAAIVGLALAAFNAHLYFNASSQITALLDEREQLEEQRDELHRQVEASIRTTERLKVTDLGARVFTVNRIVNRHRFSWLRMLDDLSEALPYDVRLVQLSPNFDSGGVHLNLQGIAKTREDLIGMLEGFIAHPKFAHPIPNAESGRSETRSGGLEFSLRVDYSPNAAAPGAES